MYLTSEFQFGRSGRKVHGAVWHHDSSATGGAFKYGNCFVVLGLVVRIGVLGERAWCLPVLFRLWLPTPKATKDCPDPERRASQQDLAAVLIGLVAERYPGRRVDVVGDSAFACKALGALPEHVTLTSRLRSNAVISDPKPPPTGKRGRPRVRGRRLGNPAEIAAAAKPRDWQPVALPGRGDAKVLIVEGLWYSVFGPRAVRVLIVCESADTEGYEIALITTDLDSSTTRIIARYADRWSIEVCFQDAKQTVGVGQARNRVKLAVERTVPFGLLCQTIQVAWYALHGNPAADVQRPTPQRTVVPEQTRPLDARHPSIAATRTDPQRISRTSRPQAETPANRRILPPDRSRKSSEEGRASQFDWRIPLRQSSPNRLFVVLDVIRRRAAERRHVSEEERSALCDEVQRCTRAWPESERKLEQRTMCARAGRADSPCRARRWSARPRPLQLTHAVPQKEPVLASRSCSAIRSSNSTAAVRRTASNRMPRT